jgi:hypothetical protein
VSYRILPWLVEQEGSDFQQVHNRWRPKSLLMLQQVRKLLKDMQARYEHLSAAEGELGTLDRAPKYIRYLRRMRLWLRQASFKWKADQLSFLQAVSGFYSDYGVVLQLLRFDQARGKFNVTVQPAGEPSAQGV